MVRHLTSPALPGSFRYLYSSRRCVYFVRSSALSNSCLWFSYQKSFITLQNLAWWISCYSMSRLETAQKGEWFAGCLGGGGEQRFFLCSFMICCAICLMLLSMKREIQEGSKSSFEVPNLRPQAASMCPMVDLTVFTSVRSFIPM